MIFYLNRIKALNADKIEKPVSLSHYFPLILLGHFNEDLLALVYFGKLKWKKLFNLSHKNRMNSKFLICIVVTIKSHLDPLILNFIMSLLDAFIHSLKIVVALAAILLIINAPLCAHY